MYELIAQQRSADGRLAVQQMDQLMCSMLACPALGYLEGTLVHAGTAFQSSGQFQFGGRLGHSLSDQTDLIDLIARFDQPINWSWGLCSLAESSDHVPAPGTNKQPYLGLGIHRVCPSRDHTKKRPIPSLHNLLLLEPTARASSSCCRAGL